MAQAIDSEEDEWGAVGGADDGNLKGRITIGDFEVTDEDASSISLSKPRKTNPSELRRRCQYAEDCYRKNPHHRKKYCHPGDEDWNSGGKYCPKSRCPFGEFCTR